MGERGHGRVGAQPLGGAELSDLATTIHHFGIPAPSSSPRMMARRIGPPHRRCGAIRRFPVRAGSGRRRPKPVTAPQRDPIYPHSWIHDATAASRASAALFSDLTQAAARSHGCSFGLARSLDPAPGASSSRSAVHLQVYGIPMHQMGYELAAKRAEKGTRVHATEPPPFLPRGDLRRRRPQKSVHRECIMRCGVAFWLLASAVSAVDTRPFDDHPRTSASGHSIRRDSIRRASIRRH
jgi:hypothetical protein